jgi:hypothetical protein
MNVRVSLVLILLALASAREAGAGLLPTRDDDSPAPRSTAHAPALEDFRMRHRFGLGVSAGGSLAVMGLEADVNVTEQLSLSGGLGTGLDYSTFMVKARYFLLGEWVSPYVAVSFARWWTSGTNDRNLAPSVLVNKFLPQGYDYANGFSVYLLSPALGVQFMSRWGFAVSFELQYLFKLFDFSNGTYAGAAIHYYF